MTIASITVPGLTDTQLAELNACARRTGEALRCYRVPGVIFPRLRVLAANEPPPPAGELLAEVRP